MVKQINLLLQEICDNLNSNSLNYCLNIRFFDAPEMAGVQVEEIIKRALNSTNVEVGNTLSQTIDETIKQLTSVIDYTGSMGTHPNLSYINSQEFVDLKEKILDAIRDLLTESDQVIGFWLKEGHPFYPVFWDFACLIEKDSNAYVLIGSSSD
jgi:hypothetical protein